MRYGENSGVPFRVTTPGTTTQQLAPLLPAEPLKVFVLPNINAIQLILFPFCSSLTRLLFVITITRRLRQQKQSPYAQDPFVRPVIIHRANSRRASIPRRIALRS